MPAEFQNNFKEELELLRKDHRKIASGFNGNDRTVVRKLAKTFALADKMETLFPGKLATLRTFLVRASQERELYSLPDNAMTVDQEIDLILAEGAKNRFACDIYRKIYEALRPMPLKGNRWLEKIMDKNILVGVVDMREIFLSLMNGETTPIESIFSERAVSLEVKLASRKEGKDKQNKLPKSLAALNTEKQKLLEALKFDKANSKVRIYDQAIRERVGYLFDAVLQRALIAQDKPFDYVIGKEFIPYRHYDSVSELNEMRRGLLIRKK